MQNFVFYSSGSKLHFCTINLISLQRLIRTLMSKQYISAFFLTLWVGLASAQGWERVYGGGGFDALNGIAQTPDGGFILAGYYGLNKAQLIKVDADGKQQWNRQYGTLYFNSVIVSQDGGYLIAGYTSLNNRNVYLLKTDAAGNVVWEKNYGGTLAEEGNDLVELGDGSIAITGFRKVSATKEELFILKTSSTGAQLWWNNYAGAAGVKKKGYGIVLAPNNDLVVAGEIKESDSVKKDMYVVRVDDNSGTLVWANKYGLLDSDLQPGDEDALSIETDGNNFIIVGTSNTEPDLGVVAKIDGNGGATPLWVQKIPLSKVGGISKSPLGGFFITGYKIVSAAQQDLFITRLNSQGDILCEAIIGKGGPDEGVEVVATADGGAVAAGYSYPSINGNESTTYLVKADKSCLVFTSYIEGNIFFDANLNCTRDADELPLRDWIVKIQSPNATRYALASADGSFNVAVDTGTYQLTLFSPNVYWAPCSLVTTVNVPAFYDSVAVDLPIQKVLQCPRNEIDIATPVLHRCDTNVYTVRYCNFGTAKSSDTRVEIELDPFLTLTESSIPVFQQNGNTYTFLVGTLNTGQCGSFTLSAYLDCASTVKGQAHCVAAHITPDSSCILPSNWDGSVVQAQALCDGDSIRLLLINNTPFPTSTLQYVIAEDIIMLLVPNDPNVDYTFDYQLEANTAKEVFTHEADGKTYRIIAQQSVGYPGESPLTTAAVEGCITDTSSNPISLGFYTMFPEDDAEPFKASDCQESEDTDYNPTFLKRGHPKGYNDHHYVSPQTDLDFLIRFVNTGTDTVQQVIIRDTLSAALDPATVHPGTASHPYQFDIYGGGIVQFTIPNAHLIPGSSGGEGFVKFRVGQRDSLPCETTILNTAAVYFDLAAPIMTNETYHTVCMPDSFLIVKTIEILTPGANLRVFPNPFNESATFDLSGIVAHQYGLEVYDTQGRLIKQQFYTTPMFELYRSQIPSGVFFYRIVADGRPVAAGKLIAQ